MNRHNYCLKYKLGSGVGFGVGVGVGVGFGQQHTFSLPHLNSQQASISLPQPCCIPRHTDPGFVLQSVPVKKID